MDVKQNFRPFDREKMTEIDIRIRRSIRRTKKKPTRFIYISVDSTRRHYYSTLFLQIDSPTVKSRDLFFESNLTMAITKKQQIRGIRIALTVFYGFLLSSVLFHYIIHGIVELVRRPSNLSQIIMIVLGVVILVSLGLSTYATWQRMTYFSFSSQEKYFFPFDNRFDKTIILLVSGIVLIVVFILTLVFGILRIINGTAQHTHTATTMTNVVYPDADSAYASRPTGEYYGRSATDKYALAEDMTKLVIELIFILFAILATFFLYRYIKAKYAAVPTAEPGTVSTPPAKQPTTLHCNREIFHFSHVRVWVFKCHIFFSQKFIHFPSMCYQFSIKKQSRDNSRQTEQIYSCLNIFICICIDQ